MESLTPQSRKRLQKNTTQKNTPLQLVYTKTTYKRTQNHKYKNVKQNKNRTLLKKQKRKLWLSGITAVAFLLLLWGASAEKQARYMPEYEKVNIEAYLNKKVLSEDDYILLFRQTGLARQAIDALLAAGMDEEILMVQDKLFAEVPIQCKANTIISREERIAESSVKDDTITISARRTVERTQDRYATIPYVEDGDILITFNSHVFGWRNGHAAIVVDAEKRLTMEARVLGSNSAILSLDHWEKYPSFVILRLKNADKETRAQIAEYARSEMADMPYRLTAGWGEWMYPESLAKGTHCAHLVWQAYEEYGYNLDSDGGKLVTPHDLYESPLLEFVQVYGMPISEE